MIITYLRSSSFGSWSMCPQSYFLGYPLGIRQPSSKKMTIGSIVHKALELLALKKLSLQNNEATFHEKEIGLDVDVKSLTAEEAVDFSYIYYSTKESHIEWKPGDLRQCKKWTLDTLEMSGGMWNPLNREILKPELYFDFEIDEPWAKYAYTLPDGSTLEGQLAIKGTTDLITRVSGDTLEVIDWKTGKRLDWSTSEVKTWKKLRNDPQLRMYFYAMAREFPEIKHIIMSIVYIQDGKVDKENYNRGSFSMPYDRDVDIKATEDMIRERFEEIKNSNRPKCRKSWRCKAFCHYGKNEYKDSGLTICDYFEQETRKLGLTKVIEKYADMKAISSYGDGGGKSAEKAIDEKL